MVRFAYLAQRAAQPHGSDRAGQLKAAVYLRAVGSVVMARPYVSRPATLFIAVPIAAVAGMLLLGVLALVVAALFSAFANSSGGGISGGGAKRDRRNDRR